MTLFFPNLSTPSNYSCSASAISVARYRPSPPEKYNPSQLGNFFRKYFGSTNFSGYKIWKVLNFVVDTNKDGFSWVLNFAFLM